ncbi:hypothetical protein [Lacipirellula sp.]|uniref:hypothetical protein n=1 Tax=Lacipirellula sp. TaxID=2691419 RepID=UPI003D0CC373
MLEIVLALRPSGRLARRLDGREQQRYQDADNGNHYKQFDQREAGAATRPRQTTARLNAQENHYLVAPNPVPDANAQLPATTRIRAFSNYLLFSSSMPQATRIDGIFTRFCADHGEPHSICVALRKRDYGMRRRATFL